MDAPIMAMIGRRVATGRRLRFNWPIESAGWRRFRASSCELNDQRHNTAVWAETAAFESANKICLGTKRRH